MVSIANKQKIFCNRTHLDGTHSCPQSPQSYWPVPGIESSSHTRFFPSMRRVFISYSQPIRFARFDGKSVNCGLLVLDQTRALDPCHRAQGSGVLGTRMYISVMSGKMFINKYIFVMNVCVFCKT